MFTVFNNIEPLCKFEFFLLSAIILLLLSVPFQLLSSHQKDVFGAEQEPVWHSARLPPTCCLESAYADLIGLKRVTKRFTLLQRNKLDSRPNRTKPQALYIAPTPPPIKLVYRSTSCIGFYMHAVSTWTVHSKTVHLSSQHFRVRPPFLRLSSPGVSTT